MLVVDKLSVFLIKWILKLYIFFEAQHEWKPQKDLD